MNPPSKTQDHQMCYFENGHFVEMRYGLLGKFFLFFLVIGGDVVAD